MAVKLNERQRYEVVADYLECNNYSEVAEKYGVSVNTVRKIVAENENFAKNAKIKKEEMAEDVLSHMQSQLPTVNLIIDKYLNRLLDDDMVAKATPSQVTTALGTLIDKYAMLKNHVGTSTVDDPITKALKEEAERMNNGDFS